MVTDLIKSPNKNFIFNIFFMSIINNYGKKSTLLKRSSTKFLLLIFIWTTMVLELRTILCLNKYYSLYCRNTKTLVTPVTPELNELLKLIPNNKEEVSEISEIHDSSESVVYKL